MDPFNGTPIGAIDKTLKPLHPQTPKTLKPNPKPFKGSRKGNPIDPLLRLRLLLLLRLRLLLLLPLLLLLLLLPLLLLVLLLLLLPLLYERSLIATVNPLKEAAKEPYRCLIAVSFRHRWGFVIANSDPSAKALTAEEAMASGFSGFPLRAPLKGSIGFL